MGNKNANNNEKNVNAEMQIFNKQPGSFDDGNDDKNELGEEGKVDGAEGGTIDDDIVNAINKTANNEQNNHIDDIDDVIRVVNQTQISENNDDAALIKEVNQTDIGNEIIIDDDDDLEKNQTFQSKGNTGTQFI